MDQEIILWLYIKYKVYYSIFMEKNNYILLYWVDENNNLTSFLPLNLLEEKDKGLFDYLSDKETQSSLSINKRQIPLLENVFKYLSELKDINFDQQKVDIFFKNNKLEEWVL